MAAGRVTTGYTFQAKEVVTAKKLNDAVNNACVNVTDITDDITDIESDLVFLDGRVTALETVELVRNTSASGTVVASGSFALSTTTRIGGMISFGSAEAAAGDGRVVLSAGFQFLKDGGGAWTSTLVGHPTSKTLITGFDQDPIFGTGTTTVTVAGVGVFDGDFAVDLTITITIADGSVTGSVLGITAGQTLVTSLSALTQG